MYHFPSIQINGTNKPESRADLYSLPCTHSSLKIGDSNEKSNKICDPKNNLSGYINNDAINGGKKSISHLLHTHTQTQN